MCLLRLRINFVFSTLQQQTKAPFIDQIQWNVNTWDDILWILASSLLTRQHHSPIFPFWKLHDIYISNSPAGLINHGSSRRIFLDKSWLKLMASPKYNAQHNKCERNPSSNVSGKHSTLWEIGAWYILHECTECEIIPIAREHSFNYNYALF